MGRQKRCWSWKQAVFSLPYKLISFCLKCLATNGIFCLYVESLLLSLTNFKFNRMIQILIFSTFLYKFYFIWRQYHDKGICRIWRGKFSLSLDHTWDVLIKTIFKKVNIMILLEIKHNTLYHNYHESILTQDRRLTIESISLTVSSASRGHWTIWTWSNNAIVGVQSAGQTDADHG